MAVVNAKFCLLPTPARVEKREASEPAPSSARPAKLPRASEITLTEQKPRQTQAPRRLPASAPVDVCLYQYTRVASDVWDLFAGKGDAPLYQVQISHAAQPSLTFAMLGSFNDFLTAAAAEDGAMPKTLKELEGAAGVKLVLADQADPEGAGFVPWRPAFYCVDYSNLLLLLDGWFQHKAKQMAREQPFQVILRPHLGIDLSSVVDELSYENYKVLQPATVLPLSPFEAQPVTGKRVAVLNLQLSDDDSVLDLVISGHTWPFRARLDSAGITGGYVEEGDARRYVRVWRQIDTSDESQQTRFLDMVKDVFNELVLKVTLDREPTPGTHICAFVDRLRRVRSLFFAPVEPAQAQAGRLGA